MNAEANGRGAGTHSREHSAILGVFTSPPPRFWKTTGLCPVEHVGLVLSGVATVSFEDGRVVELRAGNLFHVPATPHDSWVVGSEPYVSLHFLGAAQYARDQK